MGKKMYSFCFSPPFVVFYCLLLTYTASLQAQDFTIDKNNLDKTKEIELIANFPDSSGMKGREKNIWDLEEYHGKIYIGYGNTATNPGPIDLYAIGAQNNYTLEKTISAEAIEKFRVYNDELYIPNSDPLGSSGDNRKFSLKNNKNQDEEKSWGPSLAHVRDIIQFRDSLYFLGNSWKPSSKDSIYSGVHFADSELNQIHLDLISSELHKVHDLYNNKWNWFFSGIVYKDTLVIPNAMLTLAYNPDLILTHNMAFMKVDTTIWSAYMNPENQIRHHHLYPVDMNTTKKSVLASEITVRPFEHLEFDGKLLISYRTYSMNKILYNKAYNNSAGMICKSSILDTARFIVFPNQNAIGEDMLLIDHTVYVLTNEKISDYLFKTQIFKSKNLSIDPSKWTEVLHYHSTNMARSFEYLEGYFYFGKGSNHADMLNDCGDLIRIATNCIDNK